MASLRLPMKTIYFGLLFLVLSLPGPLLAASTAASTPLEPTCKGKVGTKVGDCVPAFMDPAKVVDLQGQPIDKGTLQNKVLVVHFWATWCEPCRDEFPLLDKMARGFKSKGIQVLAVSLDTTAADVAPFYKKYLNGATPPFVSLLDDKQRISTLFGTFKVPETFIIGKDGRVKEKIVGSYTWNDPLVAHYLELLAQ